MVSFNEISWLLKRRDMYLDVKHDFINSMHFRTYTHNYMQYSTFFPNRFQSDEEQSGLRQCV